MLENIKKVEGFQNPLICGTGDNQAPYADRAYSSIFNVRTQPAGAEAVEATDELINTRGLPRQRPLKPQKQ